MLRLSSIVLSCAVLLAVGCDNAPAPAQQGGAQQLPPAGSKTSLGHGPESDKAVVAQTPLPVDGYEVVSSYPHDCQAYTQGLEFREGVMYESTGRNSFSSVRRVKLDTGAVEKRSDVPAEFFAEGITILKDRIYQLTWTNGRGFVYDRATFQKLREFTYEGEGWGLTNDGQSLIFSDGVTHRLRFYNPETFKLERVVNVFDEKGNPLMQMNELEYVKGEVYANIWHTERIARIAPDTGKLLGWLDLTGLRNQNGSGGPTCPASEVLNGIAYDNTSGRLFVTGKLWPRLYEIRVKKKS